MAVPRRGRSLCGSLAAKLAGSLASAARSVRREPYPLPGGNVNGYGSAWERSEVVVYHENYIGQSGSSGSGTRMGFIVPEGTETWLLVFSEVYPPAGPCSYSFTISGFDCQ